MDSKRKTAPKRRWGSQEADSPSRIVRKGAPSLLPADAAKCAAIPILKYSSRHPAIVSRQCRSAAFPLKSAPDKIEAAPQNNKSVAWDEYRPKLQKFTRFIPNFSAEKSPSSAAIPRNYE